MEKANNEMDLFDFVEKLFQFTNKYLSKVIYTVKRFILFNVRNFVYVLLFIGIGVGLGFYFKQDENRTIYADFTMQVNRINSFTVADIINVMSQKIDNESNYRLAEALKIEKKEVNNIRGIKSFFIIDLNNNGTRDYIDYNNSFVEDTLNSRMTNIIAVRFETQNMANFSLLQSKLVECLRSDAYLNREEQERVKSIKEDINAIDVEILALEQMRLKQSEGLALDLELIAQGIVRQTTYYQDMIDLKNRRTRLLEQLSLQRNIVTTYTGVKLDTKYSDKKIFIFFILSSYLFAIITLSLIKNRKRIYNDILKAN